MYTFLEEKGKKTRIVRVSPRDTHRRYPYSVVTGYAVNADRVATLMELAFNPEDLPMRTLILTRQGSKESFLLAERSDVGTNFHVVMVLTDRVLAEKLALEE